MHIDYLKAQSKFAVSDVKGALGFARSGLDKARIPGAKEDEARLNSLVQKKTPWIQEIPNFLSSQDCNTFIQFTNKKIFQIPDFGKARVCRRLHTVNEKLSEWVLDKLRRHLPEVIEIDGVRWRLNRFTHHWRYVHYTPGGYFLPHYDGAKMLPSKEMTVFTVQAYLNENFSGGSTRFYIDYVPNRTAPHQIEDGRGQRFEPKNKPTHQIKPETGKVLVFNHTENTLHDGEPVTEGEKYILRGDVLYTAFEEDYEKLENSTVPSQFRMWSNEVAERARTKSYAGEVWECKCGNDLCGVIKIPAPNENSSEGNSSLPMRVILLSGKRFSGKDFVADKIYKALEKLHWKVHRTSLGILNKKNYAEKCNLDVNQLENDHQFKEQHKLRLVSQKMNESDPEWAMKSIFENAINEKSDILIVSDIRRLEELEWFQKQSPSAPILLRIDADNEAKIKRGWEANPEKDQLTTEVELDNYPAWSLRYDNSDTSTDSEKKVEEWVQSAIVLPLILDTSLTH